MRANDLPRTCPKCRRESRWNVGIPTVFERDQTDPVVPFKLTRDDVDFLRVNKIAPPEETDDGA